MRALIALFLFAVTAPTASLANPASRPCEGSEAFCAEQKVKAALARQAARHAAERAARRARIAKVKRGPAPVALPAIGGQAEAKARADRAATAKAEAHRLAVRRELRARAERCKRFDPKCGGTPRSNDPLKNRRAAAAFTQLLATDGGW